MGRLSKKELVENATKDIITRNPSDYTKRENLIRAVYNLLEKTHPNIIQYSTCETHIRTLINENIIKEHRTMDKIHYSVPKTNREEYIESYPLLHITPTINYSLFDKVETLALTISKHFAIPVAELLNFLHNAENLYFQAINNEVIICYRLQQSENSSDIPFNVYLKKILDGLAFGYSDSNSKDTTKLSYFDMLSGDYFYYDSDNENWFSESTEKDEYGGKLEQRSHPPVKSKKNDIN